MLNRCRCKDEPKIGSDRIFNQPAIERGENSFADRGAVLQSIMAPEAENGKSLRAHEFVTPAVVGAAGMLRTVDFDDEPRFSAAEISEVGADGELAREFVATELTALEFKPKHSLGLIIPLP